MKSIILRTLHALLGYERYLFVFSVCKIATLKLFPKKWDYLYFVNQLKAESNILIIGASVGITTIPVAKKCKKGTVFAYEPVQSNFSTIVKLLKHFRIENCRPFRIAISNISGKNISILTPIIKGVRKHGMSHLDIESIDKFDTYLIEQVEVSTIDERKEIQNIKINGIKLVAENSELEIIEGAENIILSNKPLIYCELWDNKKRELVIRRIESLGYRCYYRFRGKLKKVDTHQYRDRNLFFIPTNG